MSARLDREHLLISGNRTWLAEMAPEGVSVVRVADASHAAGRRPSIESRFHAGIFRERPDANVVLHFQSPCATALACREGEVDFDVIIEVPHYIGPVAYVPYLPPGSPELAAAVVEAMRDHRMAMLRNHGQVTLGADYDETIQRAVFFELACEIILRCGEALRPLSPEQAAELRPTPGRAEGV